MDCWKTYIYIYIYTGIKYIIAAGNRTLHIRPVILNVLNYTAFRLLYLWFYSKAKEPKMKYSVKDALEQSSKTTGLVTWLKYPVLLLLFIQTGSSAWASAAPACLQKPKLWESIPARGSLSSADARVLSKDLRQHFSLSHCLKLWKGFSPLSGFIEFVGISSLQSLYHWKTGLKCANTSRNCEKKGYPLVQPW